MRAGISKNEDGIPFRRRNRRNRRRHQKVALRSATSTDRPTDRPTDCLALAAAVAIPGDPGMTALGKRTSRTERYRR